MIDIKNKTAFVTGSTRGIGQQIAIGLAEKGCNIIVHGRKPKSGKLTLERLKRFQIKSHYVYGDLSTDVGIQKIIDQIEGLRLNIDILYNNAAIMVDYKEDIWSHSTEEWLKSFQVNVIAMYKFCSVFVPKMLEQNFGRVVNVTSRISKLPQLAPYGASKWAVDKLSEDLGSAVENSNVKINYFDPGWIKTDMGGEQAHNSVESVLPDILEPALIDNNGPNATFFQAKNR